MAMMVPMRRNRNLLSELMTDPFDAFFNAASAPMQKMSPTLMRTDIKETDAGFEVNPSRNASAPEGGHRGRLPCFHPKARFVVCARDDRRSRAKQADQNACFT